MSISNYFPFYKEASIIERNFIDNFYTKDTNYLTFNPSYDLPESVVERIAKVRQVDSKSVEILHIMPNDVYTYVGTNKDLELMMLSSNRPDYVSAFVTTIDYGRLAEDIELIEDSGTIPQATLVKGGGVLVQELISTNYLMDAMNDARSDISVVESLLLNEPLKYLKEDEYEDLFKNLTNKVVTSVDAEPPFYEMIMNYLKSTKPTEKIPLLVGMSGVSKSAMVKEASDSLGMRLVDLRVGFMSRLDIDGLSQIYGKEEGSPFSINAPMTEFLTCTDEYLAFSRKSVELIESKLPLLEGETLVKAQEALERFRENSKTPVLFFDEITRSDKSIRGALTTIINQRIYGSYNLKEARMIAATNAPVGYEDMDEMQDLFLGASLDDVAVLDRFNKVPIKPEDVYPKWIEYVKDNFHKYVHRYLVENPHKAYDMGPVVKAVSDWEREDTVTPPYPSFRTWENVSNYVSSLEANGKSINRDIIEGLLDSETATDFIGFILENYPDATDMVDSKVYSKESTGDRATDFITSSLDAGLPTMILGVSGLGKTTRVREYCESRGYLFELVSLSTKDRMDIMGPPAMVDITKYIANGNSSVLDELDLTDELSKLKLEVGLPESVTVRAPKSEVGAKIRQAVATNTPLVLFFDEFNRCPDPTVQSAIFQAISDGQFGGVKFPKGLVKVVMAGNVGDTTGEAGDIDTALTARAVQFKKLSYDEDDSKAVMRYMTKHNYNEHLLNYLNDSPKLLLELIKSVDEGSLTSNVSSTRSLKELSNALDNSDSLRMTGSLLFNSDSEIQDFNVGAMYDDDVLTSAVKRILLRVDKWAGAEDYDYRDGSGSKIPMSDALDILKKASNAYLDGKLSDSARSSLITMISNLMIIDQHISNYRKKMLSYYVDADFADNFTEYYNQVSGIGQGTPDITFVSDEALIGRYVDHIYKQLDKSGSSDWYPEFVKVYDHYKFTLDSMNYFKVLDAFARKDGTEEGVVRNMKELVNIPDIDELFLHVENTTSLGLITSVLMDVNPDYKDVLELVYKLASSDEYARRSKANRDKAYSTTGVVGANSIGSIERQI